MTTVIDGRLERLVVAGVRRRAPALELIPTRWLVIAMRPTVRRVRRHLLSRMALAAGGTAIALAVLLAT